MILTLKVRDKIKINEITYEIIEIMYEDKKFNSTKELVKYCGNKFIYKPHIKIKLKNNCDNYADMCFVVEQCVDPIYTFNVNIHKDDTITFLNQIEYA